jgi:hypothetical protein
MTTVRVVLFDGTEEEARIEAIRSNNSHGLPLTPPDRKRAATYLINQHVDWSDGRIAEICSISPKTVAALRRQMAGSEVTRMNPPLPGRRLGRDGKRHPIDQGLARARVVEALARQPRASLRLIASEAGCSPETVRTVRRSIEETAAMPCGPRLPTIDLDLLDPRSPAKLWSQDTALASTAEGARFAAWFDEHHVDDAALWEHPAAVPTSRVYEVIDEARRRSRFWAAFAERVEIQVTSRRH